MSCLKCGLIRVSVLIAALTLARPTLAIIVLGDPGQNLASERPTPFGLDRYVGEFGSLLGAPIGPRHFITATHIGNPGVFRYNNGTALQTVYNNPVAVGTLQDLAIFEIAAGDPDFTLYAPIYTRTDEVGKSLIALGRGTSRGNEVRYPASTGELRGWEWGSTGGSLSWGTNVVNEVTQFRDSGDLLYFTFDYGGGPTGNPDEAIYSTGDSGGVIFVQDPVDLAWKIAGVNSYVDGNFSYGASGPYFAAAIFDATGFYVGGPSDHDLIAPDPLGDVPGGSYATRLSTRVEFIRSVTGLPVPEPGAAVLLGLGLVVMAGGRWVRRKRRGTVGVRPLQIR